MINNRFNAKERSPEDEAKEEKTDPERYFFERTSQVIVDNIDTDKTERPEQKRSERDTEHGRLPDVAVLAVCNSRPT